MKPLLAAILAALCVLLVDSAVLEGSLKEQLNIYRAQITIVHRQLAKECPGVLTSRREIPTEHQPLYLGVQKQLFAHLLKELHECRKLKLTETSSTTEQPTTTIKMKPTTTPTTEQPTTTIKVKPTTRQPIECQQATNYTQSWRRDHSGSDIKPGGPNSYNGWACDMHVNSTEWFRFAGAAGNRMLDRCPKWYSCGGQWAYWTDAEMPEVVGVESTVDVYTVYKSDCKYSTRQVKVMRCSRDTQHDFIYKQTTNYRGTCGHTFCGMM